MKNEYQKIVKDTILGMLCMVGGFLLSFYSKRPFPILTDSVVRHGEYYAAAMPFQWSSIVVAGGCVLLVVGFVFLLKNWFDVQRYQLSLEALLICFMYATCEIEGFTSLVRIYMGVVWRNVPVEEILWVLRLILIEIAIFVAVLMGFMMTNAAVPLKLYRVSAVVLQIVGLIAVLASTCLNLWYFAVCCVCVAGFRACMMLVYRRNKPVEVD